MPGGGNESSGQIAHPQKTTKFVTRFEMRKCFLTRICLIIHVIVLDFKFLNLKPETSISVTYRMNQMRPVAKRANARIFPGGGGGGLGAAEIY